MHVIFPRMSVYTERKTGLHTLPQPANSGQKSKAEAAIVIYIFPRNIKLQTISLLRRKKKKERKGKNNIESNNNNDDTNTTTTANNNNNNNLTN